MNQVAKTKPNEVAAKPERFRVPSIDISEKENEFLIEANMPGIKKDDIHVQFHKGELTITGKAEKHDEKKEKNCRFRQFESMDFYRSFRVGNSVKADDISARLENGVLTVHLPKSESVKPKKIEVQK